MAKKETLMYKGVEVTPKIKKVIDFIELNGKLNPSEVAGKGEFKEDSQASVRSSCARAEKTLGLIASEKVLNNGKIATIYKKKD